MSIKAYYMNIMRINGEEIPLCPPRYSDAQKLGDDEITDILLFGTPKAWQKEMDRQGFDPLQHEPREVVEFMERIEVSEDYDPEKKNTKTDKSHGGKKKASSNGKKESQYCMLHGNNNTHDTSECKTLQAQAKKLKGGNNGGSNKNGKGGNKNWKNKAKGDADDSKKELAALVKKVNQLAEKQELNAIQFAKKEPVKKRKVKWPSDDELKEEELCALDAELKNFNYDDLENLDIQSESEKEEGEIEVSDEVSV